MVRWVNVCFACMVAIIHDFTHIPQDLFLAPFFADIKRDLSKQGIELYAPVFSEWKKEGHIVFWNLPSHISSKQLRALDKKKSVLFLWEPPTTQPKLYRDKVFAQFGKIYTWDDDLVDGRTYFKFHYPVLNPMIAELVPFSAKKLCTQIATNKQSIHPQELYTERKAAISYFEAHGEKDFTFYGHGWDAQTYKTYGGSIPNKIETLKNYRFAICYENMQKVKGYITEKIFDCFSAGCIPVYLGASNIDEYIPKDCFIDRRQFSSYEQLHTFLKSMPQEEYERRLACIRYFLGSKEAQKFSSETFLSTLRDSLRP